MENNDVTVYTSERARLLLKISRAVTTLLQQMEARTIIGLNLSKNLILSTVMVWLRISS